MSNLPSFPHDTWQYTEPPNPSWGYAEPVDATEVGKRWTDGEKDGWTSYQVSEQDPTKMYNLMKSGIIPRPVAFVSSISDDGVENLAPFSFFNQVSGNPAVISLSCATSPRVKDSAANIKSTRGFTVNIISEPWVQQANMASIDAPDSVNEWPITGLTKAPSIHVKPARVKESAFSMECEFLQSVDLFDPNDPQTVTTNMILGLVKYIHVRNDMLNERGIVDPGKLKPIARLGDISYASIGPGYRIARKVWKTEADDIQQALEKSVL
ncbi:hypothetical protein C8J56DRAFT_953698 [Mycena floridula]|nr:hypothetical protein C8J56DRAFT_953698 [Mycena floridula]